MFAGLLVVGLGLSAVITNRNVMGKETSRTRLAQNLRGTLDIIGTNIRITGENLGGSFPAVEVTNGASGAPDTLTLRRNLLDEVLPVCTGIVAGTSVTQVFFAVSGVVPGCTYSGQTHNYTAWRNYRTSHGGSIDAFIYNTTTKQNEFFSYTNDNDGATAYNLVTAPRTWTNDYPVSASAAYILEEWRFQLVGGILQLIPNRNNANTQNVTFGITDFQIQVLMQDGTTKTSFTTADSWTQISQIQIDIAGSDNYGRRVINKTVTGSYFPRNVLSN